MENRNVYQSISLDLDITVRRSSRKYPWPAFLGMSHFYWKPHQLSYNTYREYEYGGVSRICSMTKKIDDESGKDCEWPGENRISTRQSNRSVINFRCYMYCNAQLSLKSALLMTEIFSYALVVLLIFLLISPS